MLIIKICFFIATSLIGYLYGIGGSKGLGILSGVGVGIIVIGFEYLLRLIELKVILIGCLWLIIGLVFANCIYPFIKSPFLLLWVSLICGYLGATLIYKRAREIGELFKKKREKKRILDTSIIIDGRITEIIKIGFLDGEFILPRFVLEELQTIADNADALKRNRGRKGFEILKILKDEITIHIEEDPVEEAKNVDGKLIILAKKLNGVILTCDYNLSKVAQIEGISVLNINELISVLKPSIILGEILSIQVVKEGKEFGQGLGYLEDGTMVIVEDGSGYLGRRIKTEVTNVLQSPSGRIIFTKVVK